MVSSNKKSRAYLRKNPWQLGPLLPKNPLLSSPFSERIGFIGIYYIYNIFSYKRIKAIKLTYFTGGHSTGTPASLASSVISMPKPSGLGRALKGRRHGSS